MNRPFIVTRYRVQSSHSALTSTHKLASHLYEHPRLVSLQAMLQITITSQAQVADLTRSRSLHPRSHPAVMVFPGLDKKLGKENSNNMWKTSSSPQSFPNMFSYITECDYKNKVTDLTHLKWSTTARIICANSSIVG